MEEICHDGQFSVPSRAFPGQFHVWKLSWLAQKGKARSEERFLNQKSQCLYMLAIVAHDRIWGKRFSLKDSLKSWIRGCVLFCEILIGLPHMHAVNVVQSFNQERLRFLMSELENNSEEASSLSSFLGKCFENAKLQRLTLPDYLENKLVKSQLALPSEHMIYEFFSPTGLKLSFHLMSPLLWNRLVPILREIIAGEQKGWLVEFRIRMQNQLSAENCKEELKIEKLRALIEQEYRRRILNAIRNNVKLSAECSPEIIEKLIENAILNENVRKVNTEYEEHMSEYLEEFRQRLRQEHPFLSTVEKWSDRKVREATSQFHDSHKFIKYTRTIELMEKFDQTLYLLHRDKIFFENHSQRLLIELNKIREPDRVFHFNRKIWSPRNYIILQIDQYGNETKVETRLSKEPLSQSAIRWTGVKNEHFRIIKQIVCENPTNYPFWRWTNFFQRLWIWMLNFMFCFLLVIPFCSPLGLRALVNPVPFFPSWTVDQETGILHPDPSYKVHSFVSRLRALWRHIAKSRANFEAAPDRGFLGKQVSRHFNVIWNHVIKGVFGTLLLFLIQPLLCIVVSIFSIIMGLTAPVWAPFAVVAKHLVCLLLYDLDCPYMHKKHEWFPLFDVLLYRFALRGVLQPVCAVIFALVLVPIASLLWLCLGFIGYALRRVYDTIIYHAVIRRYGRVPWANNFLAKRVQGPGLSSQYLYQIAPVQALALLEIDLHKEELGIYQKRLLEVIDEPVNNFKSFFTSIFKHVGGTYSEKSPIYSGLQEQGYRLKSELQAEVEKRMKVLHLETNQEYLLPQIRMQRQALNSVLKKAQEMVKSFCIDRLFPMLTPDEIVAFWEQRNLLDDDWNGLTKTFLIKVFSPGFLCPLEETDTAFKLEVQHINLSSYMEMLASAEHSEELTTINTVIDSDYYDRGYAVGLPDLGEKKTTTKNELKYNNLIRINYK